MRGFFAGGAVPGAWEERALDMDVMGVIGVPPLLPKRWTNVTVFPGRSDNTPHLAHQDIPAEAEGLMVSNANPSRKTIRVGANASNRGIRGHSDCHSFRFALESLLDRRPFGCRCPLKSIPGTGLTTSRRRCMIRIAQFHALRSKWAALSLPASPHVRPRRRSHAADASQQASRLCLPAFQHPAAVGSDGVRLQFAA